MKDFEVLKVTAFAERCPHCEKPAKIPAMPGVFELRCPHCGKESGMILGLSVTTTLGAPQAAAGKESKKGERPL